MSGRMWAAAALALALVVVAAPLHAHDFWIEPGTFTPAPGQSVTLRLRVGERLVGDPVPLVPARVRQFVVDVSGGGRVAVAGRPGAEPAGAWRATQPGLHGVAYHSHPSPVELPADKFEAYLREEGLEAVIALRAQRGDSAAAAREIFSRSAKSLLQVGTPNAAHADRPFGLPLELVAEANPYTLPAGEPLPLRLTYLGQPLAGALVVVMGEADPARPNAARSDADGRVSLRLPAGGPWLVKAVHMVAAPAGSGADWESLWASLTFGAPARGR